MSNYPRIVIAGLGGDSGKTILACGLLAHFREKEYSIAPFKKGPDYIDPAWLRLSARTTVRNLDTYLMGEETVAQSFKTHAYGKDISIIEGNRGLYDGFDAKGTHSTAALAKIIDAPVILIINARKVTRTLAAIVLGCKELDKDVNIAGIVLNQVAGKRHAKIARESIEQIAGIPVIGILPKHGETDIMPSRHLGLITPDEYKKAEEGIEKAKNLIQQHVDIQKLLNIANSSSDLQFKPDNKFLNKEKGIKIGYFRDEAFNFYYPENLEALEKEGAELIRISSVKDKNLPEIDCLYIGGGFPETNIEALSENREMMESIREAVENGMPVYAECGGLIYLSRSLEHEGRSYPLTGIFPVDIKMDKKPQGHGYTEVTVDKENPFFEKGTRLKGHEFHYTGINQMNGSAKCCLKVIRGSGAYNKRDGLIYRNAFASYLHLHALSCSDWAKRMIQQAYNFHNRV